jgi:hypothetical protein
MLLRSAFISLCFVFVVGIAWSPHRQEAQGECPTFSVSCPSERDLPVVFTATVLNRGANLKIKYYWTVSKGRITKGQGTSTIEVDGSSADSRGLTATVELMGLPKGCGNKASCSLSAH